MKRKGYAAPSLHPLSAASRCLRWAGTCLSAYLPPTTAAARIGSVGVRQAATAKDGALSDMWKTDQVLFEDAGY